MRGGLTRRIRCLLFARRGVNTVISNVILVSAVMVLGFVVQYWAFQRSSEFNTKYAGVVDEGIARIKEKLVIEHIFYNDSRKELIVYLINCGKSNNLSIANVHLSDDSWSQIFSDVELRLLNDTSTESLDVGEEGYFKLAVNLTPFYRIYSIRITTERERLFAENFVP